MLSMEQGGAAENITRLPFRGRTWIDARSFYRTDEEFTEWVQRKITRLGLVHGKDYVWVDYDESGIIPGQAECLFSPNAASLLTVVQDKHAVRGKANSDLINPFHIT